MQCKQVDSQLTDADKIKQSLDSVDRMVVPCVWKVGDSMYVAEALVKKGLDSQLLDGALVLLLCSQPFPAIKSGDNVGKKKKSLKSSSGKLLEIFSGGKL